MFSDKKNVLELTALLKAHGIEQAVLCPGSRDIPLVQALASCGAFTCHSVTDERSAGFFAIGLICALKKPCAVVVTSGSALLNLHPAVAEAYYRRLPLLIISADRAASWIGQMDGQTLPQPDVFKSLVKYSGIANEIKDESDHWQCNRVCNEAILALTEKPYAPVQLNVPIGDPFFSFTAPELPQVRVIRRLTLAQLPGFVSSFKRVLLILGQNDLEEPLSAQEKTALAARFCVYSEHLGNAQDAAFVSAGDGIFSKINPEDESLRPDLIISLGGHIVSKQLKIYLRKCRTVHLDISDEGRICDLFQSLRFILKASFKDAIATLRSCAGHNELNTGKLSFAKDPRDLDIAYSQLGIIQRILKRLPAPCTLHLANSSTVRYAAYFVLKPGIEVFANRGVNGIEGSLSAAVGSACADPARLNLLLIGDLSFFYDMNALWHRPLPSNLRIILFNNAGGEIFAALPGLALDKKTADFVCANHQTRGLSWAQECGFKCAEISNYEDFERLIDAFMLDDGENKFLEVITSQEQDIAALKSFKEQLALTKP